MEKLQLEVEILKLEVDYERKKVSELQTELRSRASCRDKAKIVEEELHLQEEAHIENITSLNRKIESLKEQLNMAKYSRVFHSALDISVKYQDPDPGQQSELIAKYQKSLNNTMEQYETLPIYKSILQAEKEEQEMDKLMQTKRDELMKLETEQEFD